MPKRCGGVGAFGDAVACTEQPLPLPAVINAGKCFGGRGFHSANVGVADSLRGNDLEDLDEDEVTGRPLAVEGIERLGVPGADEVFGFVPPLSFGGQVSADRLSVQKAVPCLVGLAQSTPRYLGVDCASPTRQGTAFCTLNRSALT